MAGLVLIDILPTAVQQGGWICFFFVFLGLVGPSLLERWFQKASEHAHVAALVVGLLGLVLHALLDGVFVRDPEELARLHGHAHAATALPVAIILHRIPVGLTVWWLISRNHGARVATGVLAAIAAATCVGYWLGDPLVESISSGVTAMVQSFMAGSLLHVVMHRPHQESGSCVCGPTPASERLLEGVGGLCGLAILIPFLPEILLDGDHADEIAMAEEHGPGFLQALLGLSLQSAPALLLGYAMAGILGAFLPLSSIRWLGRGRSWSQSLRGVALGLPLPVCSCGVVPLYRTLVERGAPATAGFAFLVATPELGVDAVLLSIPLLGAEFTVARVAAAGLLALVVGALIGRMTTSRPVTDDDGETSCCAATQPTFSTKARSAFHLGFVELVQHTGPWILLGLIVAALTGPFLHDAPIVGVSPPVQVMIFAALGIPLYVCASGATPLVAVLLIEGVSPGAALAFLLTGPATNVVTFGVLRSLHGARIALAFSVAMFTLSVAIGVATNRIFTGLTVQAGGSTDHEHASPLAVGCLIALGVAFLVSFLRRGPRSFVGEIASGLDFHPANTAVPEGDTATDVVEVDPVVPRT